MLVDWSSRNWASNLDELGVGVGVGVVEVDLMLEVVGTGVLEVEGAMTVEILSPTRTYFPASMPFSTSAHEMTSPFNSYTVTIAPGTVVVVAKSRPSTGEP